MQSSPWLKILQAQQLLERREYERVIQSLPEELLNFDPTLVCSILYYRGIAGLALEDEGRQQVGLLDLLQIPASAGQQFPDLAAACLFRAINSKILLEKPTSVRSLKRELLTKYPRTLHARKVLQSDTQHSNIIKSSKTP